MNEELYGHDAYTPEKIAERVETIGVTKANLPVFKMIVLGILGGGFIGLGASFYLVVASDTTLTLAPRQVLGGTAFSLGLALVVVAGAELFTGNNLMVMAWAARRISSKLLFRNLAVVFAANAVGAIGLAWLVSLAGPDDNIRRAAVKIATAKVSLDFIQAFIRGVLCNILVCLAVWLAMAGRSVTDKILSVLPPVAAFVAAGFEHSIANLFFYPLGMFLSQNGPGVKTFLFNNLLPVTLGNLVGGSGMVGLVYHLIYRRRPSNQKT